MRGHTVPIFLIVTIFMSPTRNAPMALLPVKKLMRVTLYLSFRYEVMAFPTIFWLRNIGGRENGSKMSVLRTGRSYVFPLGILLTHWKRNGTRIPPSYICPFSPRNGRLLLVNSLVGPPLSRKKTRYFFQTLILNLVHDFSNTII